MGLATSGAFNCADEADNDRPGPSLSERVGAPFFDALSPDPISSSLVTWDGVRDGKAQYISKCLLDSRCDTNCISLGVLKRLVLEPNMRKLPHGGHTYVGFGGNGCFPLGRITLTWFTKSAAKARDTDFLLFENGPFDVLLGKKFIISEEIITVNQTMPFPSGARVSLLVRQILVISRRLADHSQGNKQR